MRTSTALALTILTLTGSTATAGQVEYGSGVFSPENEVVCDRQGNWCADGTGISASWTERYMGAEAARNIANADQSEFVYSNGVMCTVATQSCSQAGKQNKNTKKLQKMLFGR